MAITNQTNINRQAFFKNHDTFEDFQLKKRSLSAIPKKASKQKNDPLTKYPIRGLAYCNEVGAALLPIPGYGATMFWLSWFPAMFYFGADIYDKYKKGVNEDYEKPSVRTGVRQALFQSLASVAGPTAAIMGSHWAADTILTRKKDGADSYLDKIYNKITTAKKDYYKKVNKTNPNDIMAKLGRTIRHFDDNKITKHEAAKQIKKTREVSDKVVKQMEVEIGQGLQDKVAGKLDKKEIKKLSDKIKKHQKDGKILYELDKILLNPENKVTLSNKQNSIGIISDVTKIISKNRTLKEKFFEMFASEKILPKRIHGIVRTGKLNLLKMLTVPVGFATLALVAIPIDKFTEKILIKKVIDPALGLRNAKKTKSKDKVKA